LNARSCTNAPVQYANVPTANSCPISSTGFPLFLQLDTCTIAHSMGLLQYETYFSIPLLNAPYRYQLKRLYRVSHIEVVDRVKEIRERESMRGREKRGREEGRKVWHAELRRPVRSLVAPWELKSFRFLRLTSNLKKRSLEFLNSVCLSFRRKQQKNTHTWRFESCL